MHKSSKFIKSNNSKLHFIDFIISIFSIILDVVVFNLLGNTLSQYDLWSIAIFVVFFVVTTFILIWWLASLFLTQVHYSNGSKLTGRCLYNDTLCCGSIVCESIAKDYTLTLSEEKITKLNEEYSLYLKSQIIEIETKFKSLGGRRIWIVSDNLNSEIIGDTIPEYIKNNVENNIKYNFIHVQAENFTIKRNKEKILNELNRSKNVRFLHLGLSDSDLNAFIVYLFGFVIYEYDKNKYEGYFSLRNYSDSQQIEPIYLKMPQCMVDSYMEIFTDTQYAQSSQRDLKNNLHIKVRPGSLANDVEIFLLTANDYERIQNFILRSYAKIENKDFFIISDIDTALPTVFGKDGMIISAVNKNNEIVAIQATDYSDEAQESMKTVLSSYFDNAFFAEMGWTMTKSSYQNKGLAKNLIMTLEEMVAQKLHDVVFVATIHPKNIRSLKAYLHLDYIGITLQSHLGLPRIFMVKAKNISHQLNFKNSLNASEEEDINKAFASGYALIDIIKEDDKYIYCFIEINGTV